MVWFKVDDGFHDHPKVLAAGNAAVGLWTRCGSYASKQLTDGFIPNAIAHSYGSRTVITKLVETGLWRRVDGGYQMHDFLEWNPTAEQVKERRARTADRVASWRRKHESNAVTDASRNGVSNGAPDPTRPDPTPSYLKNSCTSNVDARAGCGEEDRNGPSIEGVVTDLAARFKADWGAA